MFGPGTNIPRCAQEVLVILIGEEPADGSHCDLDGNDKEERATFMTLPTVDLRNR